MSVQEDVYTGDLLRFPGAWGFDIPKRGIIFVSDSQLIELTDPDRKVDLSLGARERVQSLREICEEAQAVGARTLLIAFDHFWNSYRKAQVDEPRKLLPDTDEYIDKIARIGAFAAEYGLGLELSLISPLELGDGYRRATGETGRWVHYREGIRAPETGAFTLQFWQHHSWGNNKGTFVLDPDGFRVFAYKEQKVGDTHYFAVDPESICEVTECAELSTDYGVPVKSGDFTATRATVTGKGMSDIGDYDRVLLVAKYQTPEMDYFSPHATEFLHELLTRYHEAGVTLNGLYSDEMHIQQDWGYFCHHENGQFALRFLTDNMAQKYAELYGDKYRDLEKWMVYFCYGQHDFLPTLDARESAQHVVGSSLEEIHETFLFRKRYYHLLENTVVDLMLDAKQHAEELRGAQLAANYHVTWAESPTIDRWDLAGEPHYSKNYEYTSAFKWSNTVQQAAAACQDYFRWGDYLTGGGNDHAEGGYADRDYFGIALACSQGMLNDIPNSYAAGWGMPAEVMERHHAVVDVYGSSASPGFKAVEEATHRVVDVLMLYPLDLVAVEERFGTWMTQYGYANYITADKLLAEGELREGEGLVVRGQRFTTLVALFEPLPSQELLDLMQKFVQMGGTVIWSGPPPVLTAEGSDASTVWQETFGASADPQGVGAPGAVVTFSGSLDSVPDQTILSHYLVDRIYPLTPTTSEPVASAGQRTLGTIRKNERGGIAVALGFRPRDDQSGSLGQESRTWFEILDALGMYPTTTLGTPGNDNTEYISRNTPYIATRFANGTTALAVHYKDYTEGWPGGFHRDAEKDAQWLEEHPLPSDDLHLDDFIVNGHVVSYRGRLATAFRCDDDGLLVAFAGYGCDSITVDGRRTEFATEPLEHIAWAPVPEAQKLPDGAVMKILVRGKGSVSFPWTGGSLSLYTAGDKPGNRGQNVNVSRNDGYIRFNAEDAGGRWVFGVLNDE